MGARFSGVHGVRIASATVPIIEPVAIVERMVFFTDQQLKVNGPAAPIACPL